MLNTKNILTRGNSFKYFKFLDDYSPFIHLIYGDFDNKVNVNKLNNINQKNSIIIYLDDARHSCCKSFRTKHLYNEQVSLIISENWYCDEQNDKLKRWPIGISTKYFTKKYIKKGHYLINSMLNKNTNQNKYKLICNTIPKRGGYQNPNSGGINDRGKLKNLVKTKEFSKIGDSFFLSYNDYLDKITDYHYALSPEGNGYDTHRFYELYGMGIIPITRKSVLTPLYSNFPGVVFVNKWSDVLNINKPDKEFVPDLNLITVPYWLFMSFKDMTKLIFIVSKDNINSISNNLSAIEQLSIISNTIFICQDVVCHEHIQQLNNNLETILFQDTNSFDKIMLKYISKGYFTCYVNIDFQLINNPFQYLFNYSPNHIITEKNQCLQNREKNKFMFILPTKTNIDYFNSIDNRSHKIPSISYIPNLSEKFMKYKPN